MMKSDTDQQRDAGKPATSAGTGVLAFVALVAVATTVRTATGERSA